MSWPGEKFEPHPRLFSLWAVTLLFQLVLNRCTCNQKSAVFWIVELCRSAEVHQYFGGTYTSVFRVKE
jgi:hypothetical protein